MTLEQRFTTVSFGTSGVRALVCDLTQEVVSAYVLAFIKRMHETFGFVLSGNVAVGMDLRPSSPQIATYVCEAIGSAGFRAEFLGTVPTPALALRCMGRKIPGVMITGSHIPFDRNGIKFYSPVGEILKEDERAIATTSISVSRPFQNFMTALPARCSDAEDAYCDRYIHRFGADCLKGWRVGMYQHSAVGRDLTVQILRTLGAEVISLGRSDAFVPIDTEAVSNDDLVQARAWCRSHRLDALLSTDGDGDRPLLFDANGDFVRGDILGLLCAKYLGVKSLAIPVSCNTAIEKTGAFENVVRTKIGSPYVVAAMNDMLQHGAESVAGFEANGGFLLGSNLPGLPALPTRDALLPIVTVLSAAAQQKCSVSGLFSCLPNRVTCSDRIKDVPEAYSKRLVQRLLEDSVFCASLCLSGRAIQNVDITDGVRVTELNGDVVHLRPSGNAPELRCYTETTSYQTAKDLCASVLERIQADLSRYEADLPLQ